MSVPISSDCGKLEIVPDRLMRADPEENGRLAIYIQG